MTVAQRVVLEGDVRDEIQAVSAPPFDANALLLYDNPALSIRATASG